MTEQRNALAQLFAACCKDEALKARFLSDPKAVMKEFDLDVPAGSDATAEQHRSWHSPVNLSQSTF